MLFLWAVTIAVAVVFFLFVRGRRLQGGSLDAVLKREQQHHEEREEKIRAERRAQWEEDFL